jgi:stearoyl-CoA desaturase (Delta-9 desaturase)
MANGILETTVPPARSFGTNKGEPIWFLRLRLAERHLLSLLAIVALDWSPQLFLLFAVSYIVRMWGTEAVYHRYFSHRSFRASRAVQFALALIGVQNGQGGPLWWAAKHRDHHKFVDTARDPHSPSAHSFGYAYSGWFLAPGGRDTNLDSIPDFAAFPEMRWLNRYHMVPYYAGGILLALAAHFGLLGAEITWWAALLAGFYLPSTLTIHSVAIVNSFCHMPRWWGGYRRFETADASINRPLVALLTLGAGYHNNHHRLGSVGRAGFAWYEFDFSYLVLVLLQRIGVIRDLRGAIPDEILREGRIRGLN